MDKNRRLPSMVCEATLACAICFRVSDGPTYSRRQRREEGAYKNATASLWQPRPEGWEKITIRPWTAVAFVPGKQMSLVHLAERGLRGEVTLALILCSPTFILIGFHIGQGHRSMECIDGGHGSQHPRAGGGR